MPNKPSRVRFQVLLFTVLLAGVTYLDRVAIAITSKDITRDLGLTTVEMGWVFSAFTIAYGIFEIPTGYWGDRIGSRQVLTRIVAWWSAFTMATSLAFNLPSLLAVRFLFGIGEAGAWPNAARTFSRWFPAGERGTAQGIFFMGAHLAGGLTPMLVTAMLGVMTWHWIFVIFGLVGFVWAGSWYYWFRDDPSEHASVNAEELHLIQGGRRVEAPHAMVLSEFADVLKHKNIILLCLMYFTQTYGFYFYITWLPTYLEKVRGFSGMKGGFLAGMPLLLSVVADLLGGLSTDAAVRKFGRRWGRALIGVGSFLSAAVALALGTAASDPITAAILISIAAASANFPLGAAWSACIDIGGNRAGVVSAYMNTAGQIGGALSPVILAYMLKNFDSWNAPLYFTAILYVFGALMWFGINAERPIFERHPD